MGGVFGQYAVSFRRAFRQLQDPEYARGYESLRGVSATDNAYLLRLGGT